MKKKSEFINYILELLAPFEGVTARSMFGGHGFFKEGLMFALAADDVLYFKTDDFNRYEFEKLGLPPFTYTSKNKPMQMSYYEAPSISYDSSDEMIRWARIGYEAALRKKKK